MKTTTNPRILWAFFALLVLALLLNLVLLKGFLLTVFLGWLIAEIIRPLHLRVVHAKRVGVRAAATFATLVAALSIILPIFSITAFTAQKIMVLVERQSSQEVPAEAVAEQAWNFDLSRRFFDSPRELEAWTKRRADELGKRVPTWVSRFLGGLPSFALELTLALLTCYFVLVDGRKFAVWISPRIPLETKTKKLLAKSLTDTAVSSVLATFAAALAQASLMFGAFLFLKLPFPPLAFGISFIFAWIPLFGVGPVWVLASLYLLVTDEIGKAIAMVVIGVVASLVDNVIRPWVLRGRSDIHPIVSLVVVFGNIEVFGILGIFTGPVVVKLLIDCLELWPDVAKQLGFKESKTEV